MMLKSWSWFNVAVLVTLLGLTLRFLLSNTGFLYLLKKWWRLVEDNLHVHQFYKVPQHKDCCHDNQLYTKVSTYLSSLSSIEDSDFANLLSGKNSNEISVQLDQSQTVHDVFLGSRVSWRNEESTTTTTNNNNSNGSRTFVLKIKKKDKRRILQQYLQHIHRTADEIEDRRREIKLHTINTEGRWRSSPFTHPSTLDTIAMDADLKLRVKSDLESFLKGKQFYHRLGRVWKRSYLLFGPSGTGKSSFVAATAKFLNYDIYDLDLSQFANDADLKSLLLQTTPRSVILIEDLDRLLTNTKIASPGILNFMDGILSCCGEERMILVTMKNKDRIDVDPDLLRPGRIDVQIYFPLCDFSSFKSLASSYLGLKDHKLFPQVEEMFEAAGARMSPAEIGEIMIANRTSPSRALKTVISALQTTAPHRHPAADSAARLGRRGSDGGASCEDSGDHGGVICRESVHTVREFRHRKLYGLLRLKSSRKSNGFDLNADEKEGC